MYDDASWYRLGFEIPFSDSFFLVSDGELHVDGGGNTIEVDQKKLEGLPITGLYANFIYITGGLFTMTGTTVNVTNDWLTAVHVSSQGKVELTNSVFTGQPFQVASFEGVSSQFIANCTAQAFRQNNTLPRLFGGYVFDFVDCTDIHIENCVINDVDAGTMPFDIDFTNTSMAYYMDKLGGYGACVYLQKCSNVTFLGCTFSNSSGLVAGSIFSVYDVGSNVLKDCKFFENNFTIPLERLLPFLQKMGFLENITGGEMITDVALILCNNSLMLGNDVTRLGDDPLIVDNTCSDSKEPHYRNMTSGENFSWCDPSKGADSKLLMIITILVSVLGASTVLTIIGVVCACSPSLRKKFTDMVGKVTKGGYGKI